MFKKLLRILFTISLSISLTSCSIEENENILEENSSLQAIIVSNNGTSLSVLSLEEQQYYNILVSDDTLKQNDIITIEYTEVQEIYPLQIRPINIHKSNTQKITMYLNVIDELLEVDSELGKDEKYISLTFSDTLQMSSEEISLIHYVLINRYGYDEIMTMNFDELLENGYIQEDPVPYFKDGLLITITSEEYNNDSFNFNAMKYKSGLAAYIFTDCKAINTITGWEYQIGQHAIS